MVQDALDGKIDLIVTKSVGQFVRNTVDSFTTVRKLKVVPEEAETVRLIYRLFMQGQTPYAIAKYLTDKNIPTPTGKEIWWHRTVENILSNEKYKGDARLQKCYTVDFSEKLFHRLVDYATVHSDAFSVFGNRMLLCMEICE